MEINKEKSFNTRVIILLALALLLIIIIFFIAFKAMPNYIEPAPYDENFISVGGN